MRRRTVQWMTNIVGLLFMALDGYALALRAPLDGAVWVILSGELAIPRSADQRLPLAL